MLVRALDVVVLPVTPQAAGADAAAADLPAGTRPEESAIRAACAEAIAAAVRSGAVSIALPAYGLGAGASPVMCAKILVQEAVRAARPGAPRLRSIALCCPWPAGFEAFQKTADGYLRHLLDVLIWGPFVTVDALIEVPDGIVVVRRSNPPLGYALPGGFVDYGESLEDAVRREAMEETGLELLDLEQMHTYSGPERDPRFHTISTVFTARAEGRPRAGDDAAAVRVLLPRDALRLPFAFDHARVLADWLARRESPGRSTGSQGR
jgi:8-oxo-dGTP diphosphatase